MNRGDINRISEVILLPLLSRCFGYANLENLNSAEYFNYPGVDLGDTTARVAVQVTSTSASKKVKETLAQFVDKELYKQYDRLIIFILTEKPRRPYSGKGYNQIIQDRFQFDKSRDIIDPSDLLKIIRFYQIDQAQEILQILEANIIGTKLRASSISPHAYNDVDPYLERTVCETKDAGPYSSYLLNNEQVLDLINVIEREGRVILCDAGVGKSTELKRIAAFYSKAQSPFHADLIPLNKYVNQSIIEMLCPNWSAVPENGLLVILDGLDEIESQNRNNAVRQIEAFVEQYPGVHVLISCRTNFYNKESEGFSGTLRRFSSYTLLDLNDTTTNQHITEELGKQSQNFMSRIADAQLHDFLRSPFYLTRLISLFAETGRLPERKAQIFEQLIQHSLKLDIEKFRTTESLIQKRAEIIETLERLALSMETLGRNYLSDHEYREIESDPARRDLIQYSALWKKAEKEEVTWQFDQNTFQEYLAARVLARHSLPIIKAFVSFEPDYPKLIPSWANTLSFLVSILDSNDPRFTELIQWIEAIEAEVIVKFETDKIPSAVRESYLQHIVEDYKKKEIVIDQEKFSYRELARFGQGDKTVRYLIGECDAAPNTPTLINVLRLLRHVTLPYNQRRSATDLFERYATDPSQKGYVRHLASVALVDQGLAAKDALDRIVSANRESHDEDVRHGLYYLLVNSRYLDDNIDVFLDGIVQAGGFGSEAGSTSMLFEALRRAHSPKAVKLVLAHMKKHPGLWSGRTFRDSHIDIIVHNAVNVYAVDATVFNDVLEILDGFLRRYRRLEAAELSAFFDLTETRFIAFEHTYCFWKNLPNQDHDWFELLAMLADEQGLRFFAAEYAKDYLTGQDVWGFQGSLGSVRNGSLYSTFNAIINELSNNQFPLTPGRDRDAEQKEMASANFQLLFNKDAFINAVLQVFENERRKELSTEQIEAIFMAGLQDGHRYSTLAIQSLREIAKSNGETVQDDLAISCIEKGWEQVSVEHIYRYMEHDAEIVLTARQRDRIVEWCEAHLRTVNFRTAIVVHEDGSWNTSAVGTKLWFFQRRLNLHYPEDIMLDMLSYENFDQSGLKGIEYFEDLLDPAAMAGRVFENLEAGIDSFYVLKNHLDYCRRQKLQEVIPFAQREITRPLSDSFGRHEALATLISFPNVMANLEQVLPQITDSFRWPVIEELNKHGSTVAISGLRDILAHGNDDERIRAAVYLMEVENVEGLRYYVEQVEKTKQYPSGPTEKSPLRNFRSAEALPLVFRLLKLSYDPAILGDDQFGFLYNAALNALNRIAVVSRENFQSVKDGILVFMEQNKATVSNVNGLHFQLGRLEKSYYTSVAQRLTLADVLVKVSSIFSRQAALGATSLTVPRIIVFQRDV